MQLRFCVCLALGLLLCSPSAAEIYRWTDAAGRVHYTQDLGQVPAGKRVQAERQRQASEGKSRLQRIPGAPEAVPAAPAPPAAAGGVHVVRVERAGSSMRVVARLNNQVDAPFILDTGASDVLLPRWVAERLGVEVDASTRTQIYQTANGIIEQPVLTLDSVDLGGAVARNVRASISDQLPIGLLGLSFFKQFHYTVDPAQGIVTLEPNDLRENGVLRGGRSESDWRAEFQQLRLRTQLVDARLARVSPAKSRQLEALEGERARIEAQLQDLEVEADRARVPNAWRQ